MTSRDLRFYMWACITLVFLAFAGLVFAQEIVTVEVPKADIWSTVADKVPGLVTLVFLVIIFFKYLEKVDLAHKKTIENIVLEFSKVQEKTLEKLEKNTQILDKLHDVVDRVDRIEYKRAAGG